MYNLFTQRFDSNNSIIRPPAFELVRRIYHREIEKIISYYNSRVIPVKSNHLLCRLLLTAGVPFEYDIDRYMEASYARSPYVAKFFNFTSDISYGKLHNGVFYGEGNDEIIIYNEDYFNPHEAYLNWKTLTPVKVLEHPISDIGMTLPRGIRTSTATGLCSITVNVPMLLLQYKAFVQSESMKILNGVEGRLGEAHFVHMYVLPGMLKSHFDIIILNRMKNLFYGAPMSQRLLKLPFAVIDYTSKIDKILTEINDHIRNHRAAYYSDLKVIPSIFYNDMQESLLMPDIAPTRQVWWALMLSRLSTIMFLIDIGGEAGKSYNGTFINRLIIDTKRMMQDKVLQSVLPTDIFYDVEETFKVIQKL